MTDLRDRILNWAKSAKDRLANEPALDIAALVAAIHVITGADEATLTEIADVVLAERTWEIATILLGGVGIRQSVFSKRTHQVDREVDAMGGEPA